MAAISFTAMYALMCAMVDRLSNALPSWNHEDTLGGPGGLLSSPRLLTASTREA